MKLSQVLHIFKKRGVHNVQEPEYESVKYQYFAAILGNVNVVIFSILKDKKLKIVSISWKDNMNNLTLKQ